MNCFDHALEDQLEPAVAVCSNCGAGLCRQHAQVSEHDVEQASVGPSSPDLARLIRCSTCAKAFGSR